MTMKHKVLRMVSLLGYWAILLLAGLRYGFGAAVLAALGGSFAALSMLMDKFCEDADGHREEHNSCEGCKHDLGGGACEINLEAECGKGEHEAWEE